jgi:hypothetical protein
VTIEQLGSLGEIIGAVATVATLAYLAIQIRQSSRVALLQVEREVVNSGVTLAVSQDGDLARIYREGCADLASITPDEQTRFSFLMSNLFANYEVQLSSYDRGFLPEDRKGTMHETIRSLIAQPGVAMWWRRTHGHFTPKFQREVEGLQTKANGPGC